MKFAAAVFVLLLLSFNAPTFAQQDLQAFEQDLLEEEADDLTSASTEADLLELDLLASTETASTAIRLDLEHEIQQANNLIARLEADIRVLDDENTYLMQRIEQLHTEQERALLRSIDLLRRNELLLSENDEIEQSSEAENEQSTVSQNQIHISSNQARIEQMEQEIDRLQAQLDHFEDTLEHNIEQIERHRDFIETCESAIFANRTILDNTAKSR